MFAPDLISIVYERGIFDARAVTLTSQALRGIALGLWAATLGNVLVRILNSTVRNAAAAAVIAVSLASNMIINAVAVPALGAFGLGLGEGVRGLVLLAGSMVVLRNVRELGPVLIDQLVVALALTGACIAVNETVAVPLLRVVLGASVVGLVIVLWYAIRVPELYNLVRAGIRRGGG